MKTVALIVFWLILCGCGKQNNRPIPENKAVGKNEFNPRELRNRELRPPREMKQREMTSRSGRSSEDIRTDSTSIDLSPDDFKNLSLNAIKKRLGQPTEVYRSTKRTNLALAIWATESDTYTVVSFLESIDGIAETLILTTEVNRSRSIVEAMKKALDK